MNNSKIYYIWKTIDEMNLRKRRKIDRCLCHDVSYYRNSKVYSTTVFNFIIDPGLKQLVSVFGIFCFIGTCRPKLTKKTSLQI